MIAEKYQGMASFIASIQDNETRLYLSAYLLDLMVDRLKASEYIAKLEGNLHRLGSQCRNS